MNYRHFSIYLVANVLILFILVILPLSGGAFTLTLRKMNNTTGYKGMLRDRCPLVVNYALKWQKAKERWINHTYDKFIKIWTKKDDRNRTTRIILGISKFYRNFDFHKSIDWENLTQEDKAYWERVESWVQWFSKNYMYIENTYKNSRENGKNDFDTKVDIINRHLTAFFPTEDATIEEAEAQYEYIDNLTDFLFKCFQGRI